MHLNFKIAIIEDHDGLRNSFTEFLSEQGYAVTGLSCGEELDEYLTQNNPSILILDIGLPGENGFEIAQRIRSAHPLMYIILLTALEKPEHKIKGYQSGADLFLPKPVSANELSAAVQASSRRLLLTAPPQNSLRLHLDQSILSGTSKTVQLNHQEKQILKSLAEARDHKISTWRLLEIASEATGRDIEKNYLELQIFRLRKKLCEAGAPDPAIKSIWKEGYMLLPSIIMI